MSDKMHATCSECDGEVKTQTVTQEFEREGVRVEVAGIRTSVCQECGEIYFKPGGAQAVVEAANSLFDLARNNQQHKGKLTARTTHIDRQQTVAA